jgi:hypothetical protein
VLTGSNSKLLSSELATILSGRCIGLHLYPYSYPEFKRASRKAGLRNYLQKGGFPEISAVNSTTQGKCLSTAGGVDSWTASGANINRPSGNVGIGISAPSEKLQVEGNIKATGLKGTGNAYACVDANGKIFRSQTACI